MDQRIIKALDCAINDVFYTEPLPTSLIQQHHVARYLLDYAMKLPDVADQLGPEFVVVAVEAALARLKDIAHLPDRPADLLFDANRIYLELHRDYALRAGTDADQIVFWLVLTCVEERPSPLLPDPLAYKPLLGAAGHHRLLTELSASYATAGQSHTELLSTAPARLLFMKLRLADPMDLERTVQQVLAEAEDVNLPLMAYGIITLLQFGQAELANDLHVQAIEAAGQADASADPTVWQALERHAASATAQLPTPEAFHLLFMTTLLFERWPSATAARRVRDLAGDLWPVYFQPHVTEILQQHPTELMRWHLRNRSYDQAWDWAAHHAWDESGSEAEIWLELLPKIAETRPEAVLQCIHEKVAALIHMELARSYELACQYLSLYKSICAKMGALPQFQRWVRQLREVYARRTRFIAALDMAGL